jgi:hypothetical protein
MSRIRQFCTYRLLPAIAVLCFVIALLPMPTVQAARPLSRSLRLGDSRPGVATTHEFAFTYPTETTVGSIVFEYCDSPLVQLPCNAPVGLDVSNVTLSQQSGVTGYTVHNSSTGNKLVLSRTPDLVGSTPSSYTFDGAVNPSGVPKPLYARIFTHASADASDPYIDFGAVVNHTVDSIHISSEVPPILIFCVGEQIAANCESAEGNLVDVGTLRSTSTATGTSQMVAGTNAEFGLSITVQGATMTSGNFIIPALSAPTESAPGNAQFGINLRNNNEPDIGADPSGAGAITPLTAYDQPDRYIFRDGDTLATTANASDFRKLTVSYIINVPPTQNPGIYTTTLTYICAATF